MNTVTANDLLKALCLNSTDVITLLTYNFNLHYSPSSLPLLLEFTLSEEDMGLMEDWHLKEVGMPIDRREGCHVYPHCNSLPPPRLVQHRIN